ncbi:Clp protease N-terminal domain-containing protein [Micromonospora sp. NPDC049559]|uniref:Clp protease N-terminal domain-containing protein n=1 Tax=Micromonospora sp. NPDC049559 TaxID=3155923 RepID=UPI003434EBFD
MTSLDYTRFTTLARKILIAAQQEALAAGNPEILPAHLLLGLLGQPQSLGVQTITVLGVPLESVRAAGTAALPPAAGEARPPLPFEASAQRVLALSFEEVERLGHRYVGTEHILLALLEVENGFGPLTALGAEKAPAAAHIAAVHAAHAERTAAQPPS